MIVGEVYEYEPWFRDGDEVLRYEMEFYPLRAGHI